MKHIGVPLTPARCPLYMSTLHSLVQEEWVVFRIDLEPLLYAKQFHQRYNYYIQPFFIIVTQKFRVAIMSEYSSAHQAGTCIYQFGVYK